MTAPARNLNNGRRQESLERLIRLIRANFAEIEAKDQVFYGALTIDVIFKEGKVDSVAVQRRQTTKGWETPG